MCRRRRRRCCTLLCPVLLLLLLQMTPANLNGPFLPVLPLHKFTWTVFFSAFANPLSGGNRNPTISIITGFSRNRETMHCRWSLRWLRSVLLFLDLRQLPYMRCCWWGFFVEVFFFSHLGCLSGFVLECRRPTCRRER